MATLSLRQVALIAAAAIALSALYYLSQSVDLDRHARIQHTLQDLKHWDAVLKRDILRTRTGLLNHYDTLVSTRKSILGAHDSIVDIANGMPDGASETLQESIGTLTQDLETRGRNLERFKQHNAILRNSLSYLPAAAGALTERLSSIPETARLAADRSWVLRDALLYNLAAMTLCAKICAARSMSFPKHRKPSTTSRVRILKTFWRTWRSSCRRSRFWTNSLPTF